MSPSRTLPALLILLTTFSACRKERLEDGVAPHTEGATKVNFDLDEVPYNTLSEYGFFAGKLGAMEPVNEVLPFAPITPLFTDEAHKARFVWMPPGRKARFNGAHQVLDFPDGAVLLKSFYYDKALAGGGRRIIETRMLFKRAGQWEIANYVWNDEQSEAYLDLTGSTIPVSWTDEEGDARSIQYRIPSLVECQSCHRKYGSNTPIGPEPQNLNGPLWYGTGPNNQLAQWVAHGILQPGYPKDFLTLVRWDDTSEDLEQRVRSYLDINCAHCHDEGRSCSYRAIRLAYERTEDPVNLGVCVVPEEPIEPFSHLVARGNLGRSAMYHRLTTNEEAIRMPLIGRSIVDEQGAALLAEWIQSLGPACQ
ncbi:MAG: hypothetical protein R2817_12795 [Flavobacteriales bacterium]